MTIAPVTRRFSCPAGPVGRLWRHAGHWLKDVRGVAAVEFAVFTPLFLTLIAGLVDLGFAYQAKLKINSAISAAAYYAFKEGQALTVPTAGRYTANVAGVAHSLLAGLSDDLSVKVVVNNDPTGAKASTGFCVSGYPPVFSPAGTVGSSCGSDVTSGRFVLIGVSGHITPIFISANIFGGYLAVAEETLVRIN